MGHGSSSPSARQPGRSASGARLADGTAASARQPGPPLAAVLFDLDGTLVLTQRVVEGVWRGWALAHGLDPLSLIARVHGERTEEVVAAHAPQLDPIAEAARLEALMLAAGAPEPVAPLCALYRSLAPARRAVVTSARRATALAHLRSVALDAPAVLIAAEDVSAGKPDPAAFLLAARALGLAPSACLVLEDAPRGVEAGVAAGMSVIAVTTSHAATELRRVGAPAALEPDRAARLAATRLGLDLAAAAPDAGLTSLDGVR